MYTDMHCHILPGVDDGAKTLDESRLMLKCAREAGFTRVIATPHLYAEADEIPARAAYAALEPIAKRAGIQLIMGFEVNWRAIARPDTDSVARMCLGDSNMILLELPSQTMLPNWEYVMGGLCRSFTPIIAHPERLPYFQRNFELVMEMRDVGCEFQIDAFALLGFPLSAETRTAKRFLERGVADYIATDAHSQTEYSLYVKARRKFAARWPEKQLDI